MNEHLNKKLHELFSLQYAQGIVNKPQPVLGGKLYSDWPIGLELEFEGVTTFDREKLAGWSWVSDGSLREEGLEFLFDGPAGGKGAYNRIKALYSEYEKHKFKVSRRTSTHVHLDARHLSISEIGKILTTYSLCETILFGVVGRDREENVYCVPYYRADRSEPENMYVLFKRLYQLKDDAPVEKIGSLIYNSLSGSRKYSALNLGRLTSLGSLEFRQAPIFKTRTELRQWVNLLLSLSQYAYQRNTAEQIINEYMELGALDFYRMVFGKYYTHLPIRRINNDYGMPMQEYNDNFDLVSVAERCGGVVYEQLNKGWVEE
ncbi:MAG: amidoligase family protein, partial [Anaerolineales bacterium]|nr:amidoligase family protein [Anaerolineales bacterium]